MRQQAQQATVCRKGKIELTCRTSTEKIKTFKENIMQMTPPRQTFHEKIAITQSSVERRQRETSKTKRKTSNLQINIECIEDQYNAPVNKSHDTPLFASVTRQKQQSIVGKKTQSTIVQEKSETIEASSTKYSYDNLIQAIRIHYRQNSSTTIDTSPMLIREVGETMEESYEIPAKKELDLGGSAVFRGNNQLQKSETNDVNERLTKQLRKTKNELLNLKDLVRLDSRMAQIVLLFDELEKSLIDQINPKAKSPEAKQRCLHQKSQAVQIENSKHFSSIHSRYHSKQKLLNVNSVGNSHTSTYNNTLNTNMHNTPNILKKFNTENDDTHRPTKTQCTKSPFRQIMNYMNRRR